MSLDGYIADARGGFDWIVMDPEVDFAAMCAPTFGVYLLHARRSRPSSC